MGGVKKNALERYIIIAHEEKNFLYFKFLNKLREKE
jgi:hypothetical protein